ncbi:hypothetical protein ABWJ92_16040 [Streptomyces sp. NPDC000609]|uniref:hypothetical protein n=1 Tax=Streptomyces sp. NPDC000609 TaxID=3160957 RepID=UPI00339488CA
MQDSFRAGLVFIRLDRVRVAQRAQGAGDRDAGSEAVAAEQVPSEAVGDAGRDRGAPTPSAPTEPNGRVVSLDNPH